MDGNEEQEKGSGESKVVAIGPYLKERRKEKERISRGKRSGNKIFTSLDELSDEQALELDRKLLRVLSAIADDAGIKGFDNKKMQRDKDFAKIKSELDDFIFEKGIYSGIDLIQFNELYGSFKVFDWDDYLDEEGVEIYKNMYELHFLFQRIAEVCENLKPQTTEGVEDE